MNIRKIIHIDMDYFFAQVEERDNPEIKGKPVAIGYPGKRGVLSTCNYIAREYGVRSAMPSSIAIKKCPNLIFIRGHYSKYKDISLKIVEIFKRYTKKIQVVSIDEAYLDVTDCLMFFNSATLIAQDIRNSIYKETGLTASAGVSFNKMLAKISSELNKPNGQFVIDPQNYKEIIPSFEIGLINGVGKVTKERLERHGLVRFQDIARLTKLDCINILGSFGPSIYNYCRGIDYREVKTSYERKSLSVERTFLEDIEELENLDLKLSHCYEEMLDRLEKYKERVIKTICVKIKYSNFEQTTIEEPFVDMDYQYFSELLKLKLNEKSGKVRLLGLGVKFHSNSNKGQLDFNFKDS